MDERSVRPVIPISSDRDEAPVTKGPRIERRHVANRRDNGALTVIGRHQVEAVVRLNVALADETLNARLRDHLTLARNHLFTAHRTLLKQLQGRRQGDIVEQPIDNTGERCST